MSEEKNKTNEEFMDLLDKPTLKDNKKSKNNHVETQTADIKFDKKEGQKIADALESSDLKKIEELIKHVDSKKGLNQTADYKFDKKEGQKIADAFKSTDPKKFGQIIKQINNKKGLNQTADYKFDKKEAQQFADALESKDISKIPHTISKEESKELLEKVGTEKSSLNKLLSNSGKQLDMETLNNAMETSNIQQNKSSQER